MKKLLFLLFFPIFCIGQTTEFSQNVVMKNCLTVDSCADVMFPMAVYLDTTDQAATSATKAYPVKYNVIDHEHDIVLSDDSVITVEDAGEYLITFSGIWKSSAPNKIINVWLKINNVNYPMSNTVWQMLGTNQERVVTVTYIIELAANDNISLHWWSDDTGAIMNYTTSQTNPTRPVCPSIILTINKISKL